MATPVGDGEASDASNVDVAAKGVAGAVGGAAAANALGFLGLNLAGFTAAGPAFGSWAAFWMSTYGGAVPAGSLYAACQSAAMGGAMILGGQVLAAGAVVGAGAMLDVTLSRRGRKSNKKKGDDDQGTAASGDQPPDDDDQGAAPSRDQKLDDDDDDDDEGTASESESETDRESKRKGTSCRNKSASLTVCM